MGLIQPDYGSHLFAGIQARWQSRWGDKLWRFRQLGDMIMVDYLTINMLFLYLESGDIIRLRLPNATILAEASLANPQMLDLLEQGLIKYFSDWNTRRGITK